VRLLALTATRPDRELSAATIGRAGGADDVRVARLSALGDDPDRRRAAALTELEALVELYESGMREPLPLFCQTSAAYAEAARSGQDPVAAAEREWRTEWSFEREDRELEHRLALGGIRSVAEVLEEPPRPGEAGDGWDDGDPSRLGRLARRLWDPLLAREEVRSR
jgi:exodeoxyribonuclease V gamma subunit